tara:strand:- start:1420 stop:1680 length:261 start_codon:yes stop_codon:yes gene_type:complete
LSDSRGAQGQHNQERAQLRKTERFRLRDGDSDGIVSRTEYMNFGELNYLDADANDDGKLSYAELQQLYPWPCRHAGISAEPAKSGD